MNNIKKIIAMSLVAAQLALPAFATDATTAVGTDVSTTQVFVIPEFSIIIGNSVYGLDWANDKANEDVISKAVADSEGNIVLQTEKGTFLNNETGNKVTSVELSAITITSFNGEAVTATPVVIPTNPPDPRPNAVGLEDCIEGLNNQMSLIKTNSNAFILKIPQTIVVSGNETDLSYDKQVLDTLEIGGVKPVSVVKIAELVYSGFNLYSVTMKEDIDPKEVTVGIKDLYLASSPTVLKDSMASVLLPALK